MEKLVCEIVHHVHAVNNTLHIHVGQLDDKQMKLQKDVNDARHGIDFVMVWDHRHSICTLYCMFILL